jgi:apolipoprotein N-acyltransferase
MRKLFFPILSGLLLWAAWPVSPLTLLIFVAWVPLLWLETIVKRKAHFFWLTYVTMFIWNVATTWWIWNASAVGAVMAFLVNSLVMCVPWFGYRIVKKWKGENIGFLSLIAFWMTFEYIHLTDWGLSWPWLTLGNVFATHPSWVQWYEITGTSGGTLWIIVINILLFKHVKNNFTREGKKSYKYVFIALPSLLVPILLSRLISGSHLPEPSYTATSNVVVVQPSVDPYEKIATGTFEAQLSKLITLSEAQIDLQTALVIWPETALYVENGIEEDKMKENLFLNPLWAFLRRHPHIKLFTGIESYRVYESDPPKTARSIPETNLHYDAYNGSALLDSSGPLAFYHKSMLVPGVETLPWFLKFLDKLFDKFGGTTAGYARQNERTVIDVKGSGYKIAPAICYESIYGQFMSKYVRNGANLVCIITNDGWWDNTPGHKQHMNYARLRAIESRRWVARSANTGISCFIDTYGNVIYPQPWNKVTAIKGDLPVEDGRTFFVANGDLLSKIFIICAVVLIVLTIVEKLKKRNRAQ